MRVGGQRHAPAALPPGKRLHTHCTGGWVAPGPIWTGVKNLAPTGIRAPNRPARSESLYRLRIPAHKGSLQIKKKRKMFKELNSLTSYVVYMTGVDTYKPML
jgi:hypothetical protein